MRTMATFMKFLGRFISIEQCGEIMAPLFTESREESLARSGKFITWKKDRFMDIKEDVHILDKEAQDKLWGSSMELCADEKTAQIAAKIHAPASG
jgi:hypothetical protein